MVGDVGVRRPDLGAVDDVLVAVEAGLGAQCRQVAAGVGLGEALAPDDLAAGDRREVAATLVVGARGP